MSEQKQLTYADASRRIFYWLGISPDVSTVRRWIEKDGLVDRTSEAIDAYCLARLGPGARRSVIDAHKAAEIAAAAREEWFQQFWREAPSGPFLEGEACELVERAFAAGVAVGMARRADG